MTHKTQSLIFCLLLAFIGPSLGWTSEGIPCSDLIGKYNVKSGYEKIDRHRQLFRYQDHTYKFIFESNLDHNGILSLEVILKIPEKNIRSRFSGALLYQEMIQHFGLQNIKTILGTWVRGDNYDAYHAARDRGLSPEEAAFQTWSGRQAAFYGFNKVEVFEYTFDITRDGRPSVDAVFTRPTRKRGGR